VADALDELGAGFCAKTADDAVSRGAIADPDLDFDEFVMIQGAFGFLEYRVAQTGGTDHDDGVEAVAQPAEVLAL
jgi:hypothetical protein